MGFPGGSVVKNPPANAGEVGLIPGMGRSSGGGHGNPLQYSCLKNPMDKGAWWPTVHGVTKNPTRLSGFHFHYVLGSVLEIGETAESKSDSFSFLEILEPQGDQEDY